MTRAVFFGYRVGRLLLVFLAVIPALGTNLYTTLEKHRQAVDGIQGNILQASGMQA